MPPSLRLPASTCVKMAGQLDSSASFETPRPTLSTVCATAGDSTKPCQLDDIHRHTEKYIVLSQICWEFNPNLDLQASGYGTGPVKADTAIFISSRQNVAKYYITDYRYSLQFDMAKSNKRISANVRLGINLRLRVELVRPTTTN